MAGIGKYEGVGNFEMEAPTQYAPFKMKAADYGNSPMLKNFGIGGTSPNKFWGGVAKLFKKDRNEPVNEPVNAAAAATANAEGVNPTAVDEATAEATEMETGTTVPPHGPEAHTGGAANVGPRVRQRNAPPGINPQARGAFNVLSDIRAKEKVQRTGTSPSGIPIYIGSEARYSGAMAQDLLEMDIDAVSMGEDGYYRVNYNNIDVDMHQLKQ